MWNSVISWVSSAVSSAFSWFDTLFDSIPGAWSFVAVVILIFLVVRHVLAPLTGIVINAGVSDAVSTAKKEGHANDHVKSYVDSVGRYNKPK